MEKANKKILDRIRSDVVYDSYPRAFWPCLFGANFWSMSSQLMRFADVFVVFCGYLLIFQFATKLNSLGCRKKKKKESGLPTKDGHFSILGAWTNQLPQERDCWILGPRGRPNIEGFLIVPVALEVFPWPKQDESCLSVLLLGWFRHFMRQTVRDTFTAGKANAIQRNPSISLSRPHQADGGLAQLFWAVYVHDVPPYATGLHGHDLHSAANKQLLGRPEPESCGQKYAATAGEADCEQLLLGETWIGDDWGEQAKG